MSMPTGTPFNPGDIVYRPDHVFSGEIATMRVIECKGRYTDCVYTDSRVHVSHPTHKLELVPQYSDEDAYFEDGPTCPSCDGTVSENAITCPCGAVVKPNEFWQDHMPGASFEDRMEMEVTLEREERMGW